MRIECTDTFLDGRDRFERGDIRTVPDADGARFVGLGWAVEVAALPALPRLLQPATDTTLVIERASHANKSKVKHG